MEKVAARAWCRVDLAGGTLDIWPLGLLHPGARTVNVAIDLEVEAMIEGRADTYRVRQGDSTVETDTAAELAVSEEAALPGLVVQELRLPPVEVTLHSASPRGGGLGASSAVTVALIAAAEAFQGAAPSTPQRRTALARDLEARLMGLPTGVQDHYPAQMGGALEIAYGIGGERVRRLKLDLEELDRSLLVVFTGRSHFSGATNWQVVRRRLDGDPEIVDLFAGLAETSAQMTEALESEDLEQAGRLMSREWGFRSRLAEGVTTPVVENLLHIGLSEGAWGGKVCGAGGGGSLAFLCPPSKRRQIAERLNAAGGLTLPVGPAADPMVIETVAG